jgi:ABC-2 type transport system ATP-binding protein
MLTSHSMADVQALCERVVVLNHGRLLFDGKLRELSERFRPHQTISVTLDRPGVDLSAHGEVISAEGTRMVLRVERDRTSQVAAQILAAHAATDLTIEDPPIEDVIEQAFAIPATPAQ